MHGCNINPTFRLAFLVLYSSTERRNAKQKWANSGFMGGYPAGVLVDLVVDLVGAAYKDPFAAMEGSHQGLGVEKSRKCIIVEAKGLNLLVY